jgi:hypothetical protein
VVFWQILLTLFVVFYRMKENKRKKEEAMKKIGILFDLDGTLMDTIQDLTDSVNFALSRFRLPLRENWQTRKVLGNGAKSLITQSMPGREDDPPVEQVLAVFKEHYAVHSQDKTRPYEGVTQVVEKLARAVGDFQPDVILAPDPDVTSECHADHLNVGRAAKQVAYFAPYSGIMAGYGAKAAPVQALALFMTAKPNRFVKTKGYLKLQLESVFRCHLSQFPENCADAKSIPLYLKLRAVNFGLRSGKGCAEGFRVLGVTHMHCFPEAGN